jgi:RNA exonuclease NGL2
MQQEVDRLDQFLPHLPDHESVSAKGSKKLHGLVVLYRTAIFKVKATKTLYLDDEYLLQTSVDGPAAESTERRRRRGGTRQTKNIALLVALEMLDDPNKGIVVGTTHLWVSRPHVMIANRAHPSLHLGFGIQSEQVDRCTPQLGGLTRFTHSYVYERCRQALILVRGLKAFRDRVAPAWPAFLAGGELEMCSASTTLPPTPAFGRLQHATIRALLLSAPRTLKTADIRTSPTHRRFPRGTHQRGKHRRCSVSHADSCE